MITYEELEPYYTKVDWEIGVAGAPGPFDAPRSRPYPLPPLPLKSSGALLERAASAMGLHAQVAPMAILSEPYDGRSACKSCGHCMAYGCEFGAKSSTLVSVIPKAIATGRCEIRVESTVMRVDTDKSGRCTGVVYRDAEGKEHRQRARAVALAANGAETARLLLMSKSPQFPHGLSNSSGKVGKYIMFNGGGGTVGRFAHPLNEYKGHVDRLGRPVLRLTYTDHPEDMKTKAWFQAKTRELMEAAGAEKTWNGPIRESSGSVHLLGTARMGNDPRESVIDKHHRAHDVPNLFICDGSSLVTSTRGQPTMTIQALAFRAADHIARFAREHAT